MIGSLVLNARAISARACSRSGALIGSRMGLGTAGGRLGGFARCARLGERVALGGDAGAGLRRIGFGLRKRRPGLGDTRVEIRRLERNQQIAGFHRLVVVDMDGGDIALHKADQVCL